MKASDDDGIVVGMDEHEQDTRRPHELSDEELRAKVQALAAESIAERGYRLSEEEGWALVKQMADESRAERGYDLSPEEADRVFAAMLEAFRS
ncbi:MAG: hypothetical protein ACRD26_02920 [Vicinamibacterales bacterium]